MFKPRLAECAAAVSACLEAVIAEQEPSEIARAMGYASAGGKRLRAFLVMESAAIHGVPARRAVLAAASVEAMHAYSLVHDDLPSMDDDDLRRGQPTVHRKWDEGVAVLTGDALQSLAFELLARPECHPDGAVRAELVLRMARAAGAGGMVLGQARDIAAESAPVPLTLEQITALQAGKTGAIFEWSATAGAVLGGGDPAPLARYAAALGLAFQIQDDIIDIEGDADKAGKRLRKDSDAGKATFVSLLGAKGAKARAAELVDEACVALAPYGAAGENLANAARFVIARDM